MYTTAVYGAAKEVKSVERTQVYLTSEQKARLETIARAKSVSMADVIREAVDQYLLDSEPNQLLAAINRTFGTVSEWKDKDSVVFQRELRAMWGDTCRDKKQG